MTERRRILLAEFEPAIPSLPAYATWNPADKDAAVTLSNGNLTATKSTAHATTWADVRATVPMLVGQHYWETKVAYTGSADFEVGITLPQALLNQRPTEAMPFLYPIAVARDGLVRCAGAASGQVGTIGALAAGDIICQWLDLDAGIYRMRRNWSDWVVLGELSVGVWEHALRLSRMRGAFPMTPVAGFLRPLDATVSVTANFGAQPFAYEPPPGANAGVYARDSSTRTVVYLGSEGFNTPAGPLPASTHYSGRIAGDSDVEFTRELTVWPWGTSAAARGGEIAVINRDGALDEWLSWEWRDAPARLYAGYEGDLRASFVPWSTGVVDRIEADERRRIRVILADPLVLADRAIQPKAYPDDQANEQARGQPFPIVLGRPRWCEPVRLDPDPGARDYQLHHDAGLMHNAEAELSGIEAVYDRGNRFAGPSDPYTASSPITGANGGNLNAWAGTPAVPASWSRVGPFTADAAFSMINPLTAGARCFSTGGGYAVMVHDASTLTPGRYRISFSVRSVTVAGLLYFRQRGSTTVVDRSIALASTGAKSLVIDVRETGKLRVAVGNLFGEDSGIDVEIETLRVDSEQIIDWTTWLNGGYVEGFTLANAPAGKITAHPIGPWTSGLRSVLEYPDFAFYWALGHLWSGDPSEDIAGVDWDGGADPATLDQKAHYRLATYITRPTSILSVLRSLADSFCAGVWATRSGNLGVARLEEPDPTAVVLTLDDTTIMSEVVVSIDPARSLSRKLAGRRNHAPHTDAEIVSTASEELRAELKAEWGYVANGALAGEDEATTLAVSAAYAAAWNAPPQPTLLQENADLDAEAARVCTLYRPTRCFYDLTAVLDPAAADALEPGQTVRLVWPRINGLAAGIYLRVVRVRSRFFSRRVDLRLWGAAPPRTAGAGKAKGA